MRKCEVLTGFLVPSPGPLHIINWWPEYFPSPRCPPRVPGQQPAAANHQIGAFSVNFPCINKLFIGTGFPACVIYCALSSPSATVKIIGTIGQKYFDVT